MSGAEPLLVLTVPEISGSDVDDRAAGTIAAHVRSAGARVQVVRREASDLDLRKLAAGARDLASKWDARGVLWIDIGRGGDAGVYLFERGREHVYGRRVPIPTARGQVSAAIESLGNIAGSAAADLIEGRAISMAQVAVAGPDVPAPPSSEAESAAPSEPAPASTEAPAAAPPPPKPPPKQAGDASAPQRPTAAATEESGYKNRFPRLGLAAGYTGNTFGRAIPWQSAISLLASWEISPSATLGLGYDFVFPQHVGEREAGFELARHPIIASGAYRISLGRRWDFHIGARLTLDFISRSPRDPDERRDSGEDPPPQDPVPVAAPARTDVLFSVAPMLGAGFRITERVRAGVFGGVDVPLNRLPDAGPPPALDLAPVRVIAGAAVAVDLVMPGAPPSAKAASR